MAIRAYADTSFLVSLYVLDSNSEAARALSSHFPFGFHLTELSTLEFTNAVALRVFRKDITGSEADAALGAFRMDIESGFIRPSAIAAPIFERAMLLTKKHTRQLGTRALDLLHVASALELQSTHFLTFDKAQAKLARAVGLSVTPSRQP